MTFEAGGGRGVMEINSEDRVFVNLAIGRIFRMASRPEQPGDAAEFHRCRGLIFDRIEAPEDRSICYARDRFKGAAGD